jgi:hypothetical protein
LKKKYLAKEMMRRNIVECNSLAIKFDKIMATRNTKPQLIVNFDDLSSRLEIVKNSYTNIYSLGVWFYWVFEKCIKNILNYISNKSIVIYIHRTIDNNEEKALSRSIEELIDALETFCSSVKEAYEATLTAELLRINTHEQVIKVRSVLNSNNPIPWNKISDYIISIFDKTGENSLIIDDEIANAEVFIKNTSNDLKGIAKVLSNFKENLEKRSKVFRKLLLNIGSLKRLKWNEHEIEKTTELLKMIEENHKNFKSNQ